MYYPHLFYLKTKVYVEKQLFFDSYSYICPVVLLTIVLVHLQVPRLYCSLYNIEYLLLRKVHRHTKMKNNPSRKCCDI